MLYEQDGVVSAIRMIDRLDYHVTSESPPDEMPTMPVRVKVLVGVKSGDVTGEHDLLVRARSPEGDDLGMTRQPIELEGEEHGQHVGFNFSFPAQKPGLYWFDVEFDEEIMTRVPLRIAYQPRRAENRRVEGHPK